MLFSAEFDRLQELRRHDDPTIDQGEWVAELKRADWPGAMQLAGQLLASQTKDLRVAAWWAEAAAHVRGFHGLANGLELYGELCRLHWDHVHPLPDGDDQELRVGSIMWLLSQTRSLCASMPVLRLGDIALSLLDIDGARRRAGTPTPANAAPAGAGSPVTMDVVTRAQRATAAVDVLALVEGARRLPQALASLQAVIDQRLGAEAPGFATTRDAVQTTVERIERLAREMGVIPAASGLDAVVKVGSPTDGAPSDANSGITASAPASRAQAIAQLRLVAEFFRRTEPHSPVAYLADRAAHWGEMPLHQWLRTVLKEQGAIAQIEELLGVSSPPPPADSA
jgi:type VI secretion system protein ImpA